MLRTKRAAWNRTGLTHYLESQFYFYSMSLQLFPLLAIKIGSTPETTFYTKC